MLKRRVKPSSPVSDNDLNVNMRLLFEGTDQEKLAQVVKIRKVLSLGEVPPIEQVLQHGVLPVLVQLLHRFDDHHLQFEAAWALTNIASGESKYTKAVVDGQAIQPLVRLLDSPYEDVKEQASWALGNIAGDCIEFRNVLIGHGLVESIIRNVKPAHQRASTVRNMAWTLSNLCRGKPAPSSSIFQTMLPTLAMLIQHSDPDVISDACYALSYMTNGRNEHIDMILEYSNICMRIVELVNTTTDNIQTPALRTLGNIVTGSDEATQSIVNCGAPPILKRLLQHPKRNIKKEATWSLSNIMAGTQEQIDSVMRINIMPELVRMLENEEYSIRKEVTWTICNATSGGSAEHIDTITRAPGCLDALANMLDSHDAKIIEVVLEAIENILKSSGASAGNYTDLMESAGILDNLEELQEHANESIYQRALKILDTYFNADDMQMEITQPTQFNFNGFTCTN